MSETAGEFNCGIQSAQRTLFDETANSFAVAAVDTLRFRQRYQGLVTQYAPNLGVFGGFCKFDSGKPQ